MSASSGEPNGNPRSDDGPLSHLPLEHAPEGERRPQPDENAHGTAPGGQAGLPADQQTPPTTPWRRTKRRVAFAGDVAVAQLRTRLSATPDRISAPPLPDSRRATFHGAWRALGVIAVVMVGAAGYLWSRAPRATPPGPTAPVSDRTDLAQQPFVSAPNHEPPTPGSEPSPGSQPIELRSSANVPAPAAGAQTAATSRVAPGRRASAGEIAMMMKRGELFVANADISGARLVFRRAAEAGDAAAALALAETYDPLVVGKSGAKAGIISDIAVARSWYERAGELGSTVARERIARLSQLGE
jgi:hypothetical protein